MGSRASWEDGHLPAGNSGMMDGRRLEDQVGFCFSMRHIGVDTYATLMDREFVLKVVYLNFICELLIICHKENKNID